MGFKKRIVYRFVLSIILILICLLTFPVYANVQYPLSEIVDYDYDNDGLVDIDDLLYAIDLYIKGKYDRAVDSNYNGTIDIKDLLDTIDKYINGLDIASIRQAVKNGRCAKLRWDDMNFNCKLAGCNPNEIESYTREWLDVWKHPYRYSRYCCMDYATDYALAAYKDLGYGHLLFFGSKGHLENAFWNGQDNWQDPNNWYIVSNYGRVSKLNKGGYIYFPISHEITGVGETLFCRCARLDVNLVNNSIDYYPALPSSLIAISYNNPEEPVWIGKWDTTLG